MTKLSRQGQEGKTKPFDKVMMSIEIDSVALSNEQFGHKSGNPFSEQDLKFVMLS